MDKESIAKMLVLFGGIGVGAYMLSRYAKGKNIAENIQSINISTNVTSVHAGQNIPVSYIIQTKDNKQVSGVKAVFKISNLVDIYYNYLPQFGYYAGHMKKKVTINYFRTINESNGTINIPTYSKGVYTIQMCIGRVCSNTISVVVKPRIVTGPVPPKQPLAKTKNSNIVAIKNSVIR